MSDHNPDGRRRPPRKPDDTPEAMSLFDFGATAQATRAAAYKASQANEPSRRDVIAAYVASCGPDGCTRDSISEGTGIRLQSVCGPVLALLRDGLLIEDGRTRPTETGRQAAVIVHRETEA